MPNSGRGSIHLFRFSGIDVFLHWTWFLLAVYEINSRTGTYTSRWWNVLEFLALFLIVMLHEFGHALVCRQVGGTADHILLWPFGGIAYVNPPQRPGATLWSIAAGPLVNVVLAPILYVLWVASQSLEGATGFDVHSLLGWILYANVALLVFNLLPVYPLDGGQILRSLLWFPLGRTRSFLVTTIVGIPGSLGLIALALWTQSPWLGIISIFVLMTCFGGLRQARELWRLEKLPRRQEYVCPMCKASPPIGEVWQCGRCRQAFDTFQNLAVCPRCGTQFAMTHCLNCGKQSPMSEWSAPVLVPPRF